VHVAGFFDLSGHLFGGRKGEQAEGELHCQGGFGVR
jgi:hypothetical protein